MAPFVKMADGSVIMRREAFNLLSSAMSYARYSVNGPMKLPPSRAEEYLLELRQMVVDSGIEIEELT